MGGLSGLSGLKGLSGLVGSFIGPLDRLENITAAYSLRRLLSSYTDSLVRLRRDSDNAESDFGYLSNGNLDTAAVAAWLGGANGYAVTWYDQSGNGRDVTQAAQAKQPQYVASDDLFAHPFLDFDGGDLLRLGSNLPTETQGSVMALAYMETASQNSALITSSDEASTTRYLLLQPGAGLNSGLRIQQNNNGVNTTIDGNEIADTIGVYIIEWASDGTAYTITKNGTAQGLTVTTGANNGDWFGDSANRDNFVVGARKHTSEGLFFNGKTREVMVFSVEPTAARRQSLRSSIYDSIATYRWMPEARYGVAREHALINGRVYISHGMTPGQTFYIETFEYDIANDTWTQMADAAHAHDGAGCHVYNNKLYVLGGRDQPNGNPALAGIQWVEEYDPATNAWTGKTNVPTPVADPGAAGGAAGGMYKIFVVGGFTVNDTTATAKCQLYYPATNAWEAVSPPSDMGTARIAPAVAFLNGVLYVYGGRSTGGGARLDTVEKYTIDMDTWANLNNLPAGLQSGAGYGMLAVVDTDNGVIHVLNGDNGGHFIHNVGGDTYTQMASQPTVHKWTSLSYYDGKIYSIAGGAGSNTNAMNVVQVYDIANNEWSR